MPFRQKTFDSIGELEEVSNSLARASRHPLYADLGTEYGEAMSLYDDRKKRIERDFNEIDHTVVWNNRDDQIAYIGSEYYNLIQHREVIDTIRQAVNRTAGEIDKGVIRDYGSKVDGTIVFGNRENARIDVEELVGDGYVPPEGGNVQDRLGLGLRFRNSFDGGTRLSGSTMGYRYICSNWMVWGEETIAENDTLHIRRADEDIGIDVEFFEKIIHEVFEEREMLADVVKASIEDGEVPSSWAVGIYEDAGFGRNYQLAAARQLAEWEVGENTTLWTLYNAMTQHLDHDRVLDVRNGTYDKYQNRAWNILENQPQVDEEISIEEFANV